MQNRSAGFTFFEFLVVVSIAGIVVIVMALNSQYVLTHVRVMKVREEHAMLRRALENYHLDYASYPGNDRKLEALDSPTAYVAALPDDPFGARVDQKTYYYYRMPAAGHDWALVSPGPDGELEFAPLERPKAPVRTMRNKAATPDIIQILAFASTNHSKDSQDTEAGAAATTSSATTDPQPPSGKDAPPDNPAKSIDFNDRRGFERYILSIQYDPTNGTYSRGDIITLSND